MQDFESLPESEIAEIVRNRTETKLQVGDGITEFEAHVPEVDLTSPKEFPPTSLIYTKELAAEIIVHTANDPKGKYVRTVAAVYWGRGKIYYRKIQQGQHEMHICWPEV